MKQETLEGNKLIAEFMGLKYSNGNWYRWDEINQGQGYFKELKYHSSWDWLMSVIAKIESFKSIEGFRYEVLIESKHLQVRNFPFCHCVSICVFNGKDIKEASKDKLTAVFFGVIQFIKWYNQNKKS